MLLSYLFFFFSALDALAAFVIVSGPDESLLHKRDLPSVSSTLDIPLVYDAAGRAVTTVIMSPDYGQQEFNFTMSTSTGLTYVMGNQCASCSNARLYNQTESTTARTYSTADSVPLFGIPTEASILKESCQLRQQNGSVWPYPNQTIIVLDHETSSQIEQDSGALIGNGLSGLIGIGTNRATPDNTSGFSANFGDSIMGQFFMHNPGVVNFTFGVMLNKPLTAPRGNSTASVPVSGAGSSAGVVHWLQPDDSAYDASKLSWATATGGLAEDFPTISSNVTGAGDWMLNMDGWMLSSSSNHVSSSNSIFATVDMLYSELYLPADQAKLIHDVIPDAELRTDLSSLGTLSEAWSIPCNSSLTFGLTVNSQNFIMDQTVLVVELPDGTCVSAIEGWTDPTVSTYLFGSRFISTIYLIFSVEKDGPNQMGFAPRSSPSSPSSHIGTIAGSVVGGIVFIGSLVFGAAWWLFRRRRLQSHCTTTLPPDGACRDVESPEIRTCSPSSPTDMQKTIVGSSSSLSPSGPSLGPSLPLLDPYLPTPNSAQSDHQTSHTDLDPPEYEAREYRPNHQGLSDGTLSLYPASAALPTRRPLPLLPSSFSTASE